MTGHELIEKLTNQYGNCGRFCAYCPDEYDTAEVKECVESMLKEIYALRAKNEKLEEDLVRILANYRLKTGVDYNED